MVRQSAPNSKYSQALLYSFIANDSSDIVSHRRVEDGSLRSKQVVDPHAPEPLKRRIFRGLSRFETAARVITPPIILTPRLI
jgi:hypothetical protein